MLSGVVPGITIFAFLLALAGHKVAYGKSIFRTIYFLPSITPLVVISLIWVWLYSPQGMFNQLLAKIGISGPQLAYESTDLDALCDYYEHLGARRLLCGDLFGWLGRYSA